MRNIKKIRQLLLFLAVLALLAVPFFVKSGKLDPVPSGKVDQPQGVDSPVDLTLTEVLYTEVENGVTKWKLEADTGQVDRETGRVVLLGARLVTSPGRSVEQLDITAGRAEYDMNRKEVDLSGGVRAVRVGSGVTFTTGTARFIGPKSLITSGDKVRFEGRETVLQGEGLEARTDRESLRILRNVSATIGRVK